MAVGQVDVLFCVADQACMLLLNLQKLHLWGVIMSKDLLLESVNPTLHAHIELLVHIDVACNIEV